jgi:quercetin dioxygenase-like cupin family protein
MTSHPISQLPPIDPEQLALNRLLLEGMASGDVSAHINSQAIQARLKARIAQSVAKHAGLLIVRAKDGAWQTLKKGIRFKPLWNGAYGNSVLVEFAAGTLLPAHRHNWLEEGIVLQGDLHQGDLQLGQFDYHVSPPGSRHERIGSRHGALAYLRGTSLGGKAAAIREVVAGLLPIQGAEAKTVPADHDGWQEILPGVHRKQLVADGLSASCFYRLDPGATCPAHPHPQDEECMVLSGEVFIGDVLLCGNDYQLAPKGSFHGITSTDTGALLYVRGAA